MFMYSDVNAARNILVGAASVVLTGQAHPRLAWYDIRTSHFSQQKLVACWGYSVPTGMLGTELGASLILGCPAHSLES